MVRDSPFLTHRSFTPAVSREAHLIRDADYFDTRAYLTQSGQLYAEAGNGARPGLFLRPTFRAEKSKTPAT
jgi:asparaginyl-tRNA synthetase